jgi:hypothetical protein
VTDKQRNIKLLLLRLLLLLLPNTATHYYHYHYHYHYYHHHHMQALPEYRITAPYITFTSVLHIPVSSEYEGSNLHFPTIEVLHEDER